MRQAAHPEIGRQPDGVGRVEARERGPGPRLRRAASGERGILAGELYLPHLDADALAAEVGERRGEPDGDARFRHADDALAPDDQLEPSLGLDQVPIRLVECVHRAPPRLVSAALRMAATMRV